MTIAAKISFMSITAKIKAWRALPRIFGLPAAIGARSFSFRFVPCAKRSLRSRSARRQSLHYKSARRQARTGRGLGFFVRVSLLSRYFGNILHSFVLSAAYSPLFWYALHLIYYQVSLTSSTDTRPTARRCAVSPLRTHSRFPSAR